MKQVLRFRVFLVAALALFVLFLRCSERILRNSREMALRQQYSNPFSFQNYPAILLFRNGDTLTGHFSKSGPVFCQVHENPDSNRIKSISSDRHFPDCYYRQYFASELKAYIVSGQRYEAVAVTTRKESPSVAPDFRRYLFMLPITPEGSALMFYKYLEPYAASSLLSALLSTPDTSIGTSDYYFRLYVHFPDEHPDVAWLLEDNKRLRQRFRDMFQVCPSLAETLRNMNRASGTNPLLRVLVRPDSSIRSSGWAALLERSAVFEQCMKSQ